jgi:hypothetical protein
MLDPLVRPRDMRSHRPTPNGRASSGGPPCETANQSPDEVDYAPDIAEETPRGFAFEKVVPAEGLTADDIVVFDGHVVEVAADPDDADRVRLVIIPALGPPSKGGPDQREIVLLCPRDMAFGVARAWNMELAPRPNRP